ncbi:hypothetical protein [Flavobacterium chungbukense]|uniref:Lipoprotein n=1 Tax=Flavobacterium chungbukense TaxID=877464 RepID=A0ABP7YSK6_9FLAO|nr:hypothetical protein [Flavobacterium chungbukense]MCC4923350.1 hypothetical protein [Flavobacterium chungbukense]
MRISIIALMLILVGCKSPKKDYDFTFFKWNIHESYYLKFNSSDTVYCVDNYGFKEQTSFTILNKNEKERIQSMLDTITFPEIEAYESQVDDGETNAFVLKNKNQLKKLKIHGHNGPILFRLFGKSLDNIKNSHEFTKTNKKIDLKEINKMVISEVKFVPRKKDSLK